MKIYRDLFHETESLVFELDNAEYGNPMHSVILHKENMLEKVSELEALFKLEKEIFFPRNILQRYKSFKPLEEGGIHAYCSYCRRKKSNVERDLSDPAEAEVLETACPKCIAEKNIQDSPVRFFRLDGTEIK